MSDTGEGRAQRATGAELFLRTLQNRGVRFVFMNPGTDTFPVQEAYAKLRVAGEPLPELLMCPFESLASSAAQGVYLATGQAQVAFVTSTWAQPTRPAR